jgi:hypothetical protein
MQARGEQRTRREADEKPPRSFVKFSEGCMISDQWYQWSSVRILVPEGDLERYAAADKIILLNALRLDAERGRGRFQALDQTVVAFWIFTGPAVVAQWSESF